MENELDSFLKDVNEPESDPFKSDTVEESTVEEKKDEEPLPFHKDPKVQKFIEREIEKRMSSVQPQVIEKEVVKEITEDPLLNVLTRIIGNDTPEKLSAIKDFQKALDSRDENIRKSALDELDAREQEERQAEIDAQNELLQGFENIEETFGVDLTSPKSQQMRSDFVDFIKQVAPKDENGQVTEFPDLEQTFKLFQDIQKFRQPNSNRARELAARSIGRNTDSTDVPQNTDKSWNAVEKWFSKLTG